MDQLPYWIWSFQSLRQKLAKNNMDESLPLPGHPLGFTDQGINFPKHRGIAPALNDQGHITPFCLGTKRLQKVEIECSDTTLILATIWPAYSHFFQGQSQVTGLKRFMFHFSILLAFSLLPNLLKLFPRIVE